MSKRLSVFCGHFGCGKTNVAINYAMELKKTKESVIIADLDIVNPYFRTKDSEKELQSMGIEVMSLPFANTSVDLPALPKEVYSLFSNRDRFAVLDIGGDERGACVLGRFAPYILKENDFDFFYVVNFYRYLTRTPIQALELMREIEEAAGLGFTAIINNSNLGRMTTAETVAATFEMAQELCDLSGLMLAAVTAAEETGLEGAVKLRLQEGLL